MSFYRPCPKCKQPNVMKSTQCRYCHWDLTAPPPIPPNVPVYNATLGKAQKIVFFLVAANDKRTARQIDEIGGWVANAHKRLPELRDMGLVDGLIQGSQPMVWTITDKGRKLL